MSHVRRKGQGGMSRAGPHVQGLPAGLRLHQFYQQRQAFSSGVDAAGGIGIGRGAKLGLGFGFQIIGHVGDLPDKFVTSTL